MKNKTGLWIIIILLCIATACTGSEVSSGEVSSSEEPLGNETQVEQLAVVAETPIETADTTNTVGNLLESEADQAPADGAQPVAAQADAAQSSEAEATTGDAAITTITLMGDTATVDGNGATADANGVTISEAGSYSIQGTLSNGQIIVDTEDEEDVVLLLGGVDITSASSAPIYVSNANNTVITLVDGTENYVSDGANYVFPDAETDEPNGAIFSHDDLFINGSGSLIVNGNFNHGIVGKDDLEISGGNIIVNAVNDGIKGRDSLVIEDVAITINAGGDGMQSNNDEDEDRGYVQIESGTLNITAGEDGIQAETRLMVSGGEIALTTGGGSSNGLSADASAKALKAGVDVTITGGNITIDAADDAIHSNESLTIDSGTIQLASGDDGIHADAMIQINNGEINISRSYEGIESEVIVINGGSIRLASSDDGINIAGGADGSALNGRPGQNSFADSGNRYLAINGGTIYIEANGDGLDANGNIEMSAGTVIVNGPTASNNSAIDYDGAFSISGGSLVAAGSSRMAQAPGTASTQYSIIYNFTAVQPAGTTVHIESAAGENILTFTPLREYQSIAVSSPTIQNGETYTIFTGGDASGSATNGLFSDSTYDGGTAVESFTVSEVTTSAGVASGGSRGGNGPRRP